MSMKLGFIKQGELIEISRIEATDSCIPAVSPEVLENFRKFALNLKKVAPKAEDFLYFSAVMMHAAEASAINDDGTPKLNAKGETVQVGWDKSGGTWKWATNDPNIKPYKNSNGDIFPEEELVKAYKKWQHKPLCIDHKSSSVDHVRGFIVDTYYDRNLKRVIALCALDKAGYPQLARQVATGVSNCVSMGTAVGRAICSDCARVARAEADFCDHMRRKTCYGEINVDLNPIELSIVVNGADPKANIKHIIAAANTLNTYLENKSKELNKLADLVFSAKLIVSDPKGNEGGGSTEFNVQTSDIEKFKSDLDSAFKKLEEINSSAKISRKDTNDMVSNQITDHATMDEGSESGLDDLGLAPPHARYASAELGEDSIAELRKLTLAIETKLDNMKHSLDKLVKTSINKQEENMTGSNEINKVGYYQGTEEPTPGQPKYTKDPLNEKLRTDGDKQMSGQGPFPGVGPVDGVHPSPESADVNDELERKKMLARAESEERYLKRHAIVNMAKQAIENKKSWFLNGEGPNNPNTPTPGKPKYPKDKLNEELRDNEDKQMVGQKPFPDVGSVDGLHPSPQSADVSDEKKRKEMLARAQLRARFVKATDSVGSPDLGNSAWEVFQGDKLILTASVAELTNGRTDIASYNTVANTDFGAKLLQNIKTFGSEGFKAIIKKAQTPDVGAPAAPEAPPAGETGSPEESEDTGQSGDPKVAALKLAEKVRDLSSDLVEAVRALTGDQAEMGMEGPAGPTPEMGMTTASDETFSVAAFNSIRKELNGALTTAMKESIANLNDHQQELEFISGMYDRGAFNSQNEEAQSVIEEALTEAKTAVAEGFKLMTAFVKYARGTKAIVKRAEIEAELEALAEGENMSNDAHDAEDDLMNLIHDTNVDLEDVKGLMGDDHDDLTSEPHDESLEGLEGLESGDLTTDLSADDADADISAKKDELKDLGNLPPGSTVHVTAGFETKDGRAAMRAKLAADALGKQDDGQTQDMSKAKFSDMLDEADHLADGQTQLDTKPSDNLGKVETLPEVNKEMMDVALAPPKVRKEAEAIQKLVSEGKLDPSDMDALIAEGLDSEAVSYWKKYYGQADGGSEFASELVKEHVKAELEAELNHFKVKLARAYELAYDMADRGLCHRDRASLSDQVDEIMKCNDDSFESLRKVVARHAPLLQKDAGRMPQVGFLNEENNVAPVSEYAQLSELFAKSNKRGSF